MKKTKAKVTKQVTEKYEEVGFIDFAISNYKDYMMAVVEDRAIPDFRDGMIPVARRVLWSMFDLNIRSNSKPVKAARVVGEVMGKYHPHGDSSTYGAMVNMTNRNSPFPLIKGEGNWGSMTEPGYAAMRYTESRLDKRGDVVMFDKFYTPAIQYVPNYDGAFEEPLILPAILPTVLLTGKSGVAPGASTYIPAVTPKSLVKTLIDALENKAVVEYKAAYKTIRFTSTSGGVEQMPTDDEAKKARMAIFKTIKGKAVLESSYSVDEAKMKITVTAFADHWGMHQLIEKLLAHSAVKSAVDDTSKADKYATLVITLKPAVRKEFKKTVQQIVQKFLTVRENYVLNFTERFIDETGQAKARMRPMSLTQTLQEWILYRIDLERRACAHWINEASKAIRKLQLLVMACDNLDFLFKLLKDKLDRPAMDKAIAKKFKITEDEAHVITEMKYYQLSRLEKQNILNQIKETEKQRKGLESRKAKPIPHIIEQLKGIGK